MAKVKSDGDGLPSVVICEDLAEGKEEVKIPVINTVDSDDIPYGYVYVPENVEEVQLRSHKGCNCVGVCLPKKCECIKQSTIKITKERTIDLTKRFPDYYNDVLFECNERTCKGCKGKCGWRLTPEKFDVEVEMFKTPKAGWAVRSRQFIQPGAFVAEFVGEVVDHVLQEHRPLEYAYRLTTDASETDIYIDPYKYGNISRFFNHSCFENLQPFRFYSSHRHTALGGSIGFFARRDILPGQELTIDYGSDWWSKNIVDAKENGRKLYCHCDWVYCMNPEPGKPQMSQEDAREEMQRQIVDNHRKLMAWKRGKQRREKAKKLGKP